MKHRHNNKQGTNRGQIVAEYSILIGIIVAALVAMNIYIKRGMQARFRDAVDLQLDQRAGAVGDTKFVTGQYEPDYSFRTALTTHNSDGNEQMVAGGSLTSSRTSTGLTTMMEIINGTQ